MRPDSRHQRDGDESSRIIYLGDVRRRKTRRGAPDAHYLAVPALVGLFGWACWLAVLFTVQPNKLLTYCAFFVPLSLALAGTGTLIAYAIEWRRGLLPDLARCFRRAVLVTAAIIWNLSFLAAHRWGLPLGGVSVVAVILVDLVFAYRAAR